MTQPTIITGEKNEIKYSFDTFIVNYPYYHSRISRQKIAPNAIIDKKLSGNLKDLKNTHLLQFDGFKDYLKAFLYVRSKLELQNPGYRRIDNQFNQTLANVASDLDQKVTGIEYRTFGEILEGLFLHLSIFLPYRHFRHIFGRS